ncbi:Ig-like domain-containing protein [Algibacter sp.]|nr:Ig-like domain-containing protein [Algibacter sp.]
MDKIKLIFAIAAFFVINLSYSQTVTLETSSNTITENESVTITATLDAPTSQDVIVSLGLNGIALENLDFTTDFLGKGIASIVAGGNGEGNNSNQLYTNTGITVDAIGNMYINDRDNHRIQKWVAGAISGTTVAGGNGQGANANQLSAPTGFFIDNTGDIYVADEYNSRIMKWTPGATEGVLVAGGNGQGPNANQLSIPRKLYVDSFGNIYINDVGNNRIQKWAPGATEGITVAGGNGAGPAANQLNNPQRFFVETSGDIYISDFGNHRVQKWTSGATSGVTVAGGNGAGSNANQLYRPFEIHFDALGNLYIADYTNHRIQKWAPGATEGITVAGGNGAGSNANQLIYPVHFYLDIEGNIYIHDMAPNHRIHKWTPGATVGITVAGDNSNMTDINEYEMWQRHFFVDTNENIYISDFGSSKVVKYHYAPQIIIPAGQTTGTFTITGVEDALDENDETIILTPSATNATLSDSTPINITLTDLTASPIVAFSLSEESIIENAPTDVTLTATLSNVSALDVKVSFSVSGTATETSEYALSSNIITISAGSESGNLTISTNGLDDTFVEVIERIIFTVNTIANATAESDTITLNLISDDDPNVSISANETSIAEFGGVSIITATLDTPTSQDVIIDLGMSGTAIEDIDFIIDYPGKGEVLTVAGGNGNGSAANQLSGTQAIYVDNVGNVYVAEYVNSRIQKWKPGATVGITVAGGNGVGCNDDQLAYPTGVSLDNLGNIYIAHQGCQTVVKWIEGNNQGTTVAGTGEGVAANQMSNIFEIFVDTENNIYVCDGNNQRIQKWAPGATEGITVAGGNGNGSAANQLGNAYDVHVDLEGNIYVADGNNQRIQKWAPGATEGITVAGGNGDSKATNQFSRPWGVFLDVEGNIYVGDTQNKRVQKWAPGATEGITVAGGNGDSSASNQFGKIVDVFINSQGFLYVADEQNSRVQKFQIASQIIIPAGQTTGTFTITGVEDDLNEDHETVILTPIVTNAILTSTTPVSITILDNNFPPVANADDITVNEGGSASVLSNTEISVLQNDTDYEGDVLTAVLVNDTANGLLILNPDGTFLYTHDGSETLTDSFTYKANDGLLDSNEAIVAITISPVNNNEPTDIILSNSDIEENISNQLIGVLSAEDLDSSNVFTFTLFSGTGDTNNSDFEIINENELTNITVFDYEMQNEYSIRVKVVDSEGFSFEKVLTINIINQNDILIEAITENTYCNDDSASGSIDITVTQTIGTVSYLWSGPNAFNSIEEDVSNLPEGTYTITVTDSDFSKSQNFVIETTPIFSELDVCYVTSDATDFSKNRIHLSFNNIYNASKYQILREGSSTGQYDVIGELDPTETSFLDNTSNNNASSYNYKARLLDNCGNLSSESSAHKTILLQSSIAVDNTVNLSWSQYLGTDYSSYFIYRSVDGGDFEELTSLASTNQSYNDTSANINEFSYVYYVSIRVNSCETTEAKVSESKKEGSIALNEVEIRSNQILLGLSSSNDGDEDGVINDNDLYPNTPDGATVDANGGVVIDPSLLNISWKSSTCPNINNAEISIQINESYPFNVTVNGPSGYNNVSNNQVLTSPLVLTGLTIGEYQVSFSFTDGLGADFNGYTLNISEALEVTGKSIKTDKTSKTATFNVSGDTSYSIYVNDEYLREVIFLDESVHQILVDKLFLGENYVKIVPKNACRGIVEQWITIQGNIQFYPNPTQDLLTVRGLTSEEVNIQVFNTLRSQLYNNKYRPDQGVVRFSLANFPSGVYIVKVIGNVNDTVEFKVVKK